MLQVADRTIEDAEERGTETMSVATILGHSSNVGAVTVGLAHYTTTAEVDQLVRALASLGPVCAATTQAARRTRRGTP